MAGINISFASDVRPFLKGTGDAARGLEDVADSLDDLARDAERKGQAIGDDLEKVGTEGQDAAKKLERKFRDAFDDVKKEAKTAGDAVGDHVKRGTDKAEDGLGEMKREAGSTARESAASFDGSAQSIGDSFQEIAANAFAGFGPAGAAAGLLIAAGLGAGMTMFGETSEAAKARISEIADAMIEANARVLTQDFINEQLRKIYTGADDAAIKLGNLQKVVEATGATESEVARAYAGDADARAVLLARIITKQQEVNDTAISGSNAEKAALMDTQRELQRVRDGIEALGTEHDTAASRAEGYRDSIAGVNQASREQIGETRQAYEDAHRAMNDLTPPVIRPTLDTAAAERALEDFVRRTRKVEIGVSYRGGQAVV